MDTATWTPAAQWRADEGRFTAVALTPDGARLAKARRKGSIEVRRLPGGEVVTTLSRKTAQLAISPDGALLAVATGDSGGAVRVSELRCYVEQRVHALTKGLQNPTARRENLLLDSAR